MNTLSRATLRPEDEYYPSFGDDELPCSLRHCAKNARMPLLVYGLLVYSSLDEIIGLAYELNLEHLSPREELARRRNDLQFIVATVQVFEEYISSRLAREYSFHEYEAEPTFTRIIGPDGEQAAAVVFSLYNNMHSESDRAWWSAHKATKAIQGLKNIFRLPDDTPLRWYFSTLCRRRDKNFDVFQHVCRIWTSCLYWTDHSPRWYDPRSGERSKR
ncbi:hypothetical protein FKP32DRAFT_115630 [Trametes sanguinea]|nr:hypothetical protein FKP32DRAFT_115630 [Trametes sanguinea]